ncbi:MAG: DNA-processing protein DprA [Candidatus Zixiibacteriota bacterium]
MTNNELTERLIDTIALLNVPGVGKGRFHKLVAQFGTPARVMAATVWELEAVPLVSHTTAASIRTSCDRDKAKELYARIVQLGWSMLFPEHPEYPKQLLPLADRPALLFRLGEPTKAEDKMIAIVGTRHASERGRAFARNLAADLAKAGVIVVSGMAEGIDSAAHQGALEAGGKTIAVWGTPLNHVYPTSNRGLADRIMRQGAAYSEYFPDIKPEPGFFPERNRIISGLSEGVVVVEAGRKSGALITADLALEQGKELFAVPGGPESMASLGTNALIKKGAKLLTNVEDIFDELPRLKGQVVAQKFQTLPDLTDTEKQLVGHLASGPLQIDQLSRTAGLPVAELLEYLLALELKGAVQELSGKRYVLVE